MTDNGFLKLDNSIIDYWMAKLNHSEFKTLLAVYRKTVGWSKQYDRISQSQLSDLTGLTTRSIGTAITSLESLGLVITAGKDKTAKIFSLNLVKLYSVCLKTDEVLELETKLEDIAKSSEVLANTSENNSSDIDVNFVHKRNSKDITNKQIKEPVINIPFDEFWDLYDYKKNKQDCNNKWLSMTDEERQLTMDNLALYIKSTPDKTFRKYPINYLNNEMWNDEVIIPVGKEIAHDNNNGNVFSASHKEFEPVFSAKDSCSTKHTKDDEECNLEALGLSSGKTTDNINTKDCTNNGNTLDNKSINKINSHEDILSRASRTHWSELKSKGLLKKKVNPDALCSNTDADSKVNEFLARYGSKGYCKDIA